MGSEKEREGEREKWEEGKTLCPVSNLLKKPGQEPSHLNALDHLRRRFALFPFLPFPFFSAPCTNVFTVSPLVHQLSTICYQLSDDAQVAIHPPLNCYRDRQRTLIQ